MFSQSAVCVHEYCAWWLSRWCVASTPYLICGPLPERYGNKLTCWPNAQGNIEAEQAEIRKREKEERRKQQEEERKRAEEEAAAAAAVAQVSTVLLG